MSSSSEKVAVGRKLRSFHMQPTLHSNRKEIPSHPPFCLSRYPLKFAGSIEVSSRFFASQKDEQQAKEAMEVSGSPFVSKLVRKESAKTSEKRHNLHYVNREHAFIQFFDIYQRNRLVTRTDRPYVAYVSHRFGAGKSDFGLNVIDQLQQAINTKKGPLYQELLLRTSWAEAWDQWANAVLVYIDLAAIRPDAHSKQPSLDIFLKHQIHLTFKGQEIPDKDIEKVKAMTKLEQFFEYLDTPGSGQGPVEKRMVYLFLDEIQILEHLFENQEHEQHTFKEFEYYRKQFARDGGNPQLQSYRALFQVLANFARNPRVMLFAAGRGAPVYSATEPNLVLSTAISEVIYLNPFTIENIKTILEETKWESKIQGKGLLSIRAILEQRSKLKSVDILAEKIHQWTGGVPRQVLITLLVLTGNTPPSLSDPVEIEDALGHLVLHFMKTNPSVDQPKAWLDVPEALQPLITKSLLYSLTETTVPEEDVPTGSEVDTLAIYGFTIEQKPNPDPQNHAPQIKIGMSKYSKHIIKNMLEKNQLQLNIYSRFVGTLLKSVGSKFTTKQGGVFELIILNKIANSLHFQSFAKDPIFKIITNHEKASGPDGFMQLVNESKNNILGMVQIKNGGFIGINKIIHELM